MLERLRSILTKIKFTRKNKIITESTNESEDNGGKIYAAWLFVLPVLIGLVLGRLASIGMGFALEKFSSNAGMNDSAVTGFHENLNEGNTRRGLDEFLSVNPFHISPLVPVVAPEPPKPSVDVKPKEPDPTLDDVILRGTLPGTGAWIENKGKTQLILVGRVIEKYRLASVSYSEAVFMKGRETVTKYITYGPVVAKKKQEPKKAETPAPAPKPAEPPAPTGDIVAAAPGTQEGQVPSEVVQQLVQNPFDELKRIRMRPNEKAGGLEVQWIQNDSILKKLGVQRGDVIKSVNGIPFTNMGDIANSINSLMNSERFDVEVTRGGKSTPLRYVVK